MKDYIVLGIPGDDRVLRHTRSGAEIPLTPFPSDTILR